MLTVDKYVAFVYSFHVFIEHAPVAYKVLILQIWAYSFEDGVCPFINITCLLISISWEVTGVLLCGRDDE